MKRTLPVDEQVSSPGDTPRILIVEYDLATRKTVRLAVSLNEASNSNKVALTIVGADLHAHVSATAMDIQTIELSVTSTVNVLDRRSQTIPTLPDWSISYVE